MLIYEVRHPDDPTRTVKYQVSAYDELKLNERRRSSSNSSRGRRRRATGAFLGLKPASVAHENNKNYKSKFDQDISAVGDNSLRADDNGGNLADMVSSFYRTAKDDSALLADGE